MTGPCLSQIHPTYSSITHLLEQVSQLGEGAGGTSEVGIEQWSSVWAPLLMQPEPFWAGAWDNGSHSIVAQKRLSLLPSGAFPRWLERGTCLVLLPQNGLSDHN